MRKRAIILVLVTGTIALLLFSVLKNERAVTIVRQDLLSGGSLFSFRNNKPIKKLSLVIENTGQMPAAFYISPPGVNTLNDSSLINSIGLDTLNDEQKCIRLWKFIGDWTDHGHADALVEHNYYSAAAMVNGIEEGICDKRSAALANLATCAGIPGRVYKLKSHVVTELFYSHAWHMFDADKEIYYRRPDGEIADMAYLNSHPQIISAETKNIKGFMPKWRNEDTRRSLSTSNYVDTVYKVFDKGYSAALQLLPGEKLCFELKPINPVKKFIRSYLGKRDNPCFVRSGIKTSKITAGFLKPGKKDQKVYGCKMPYPIKQVKVCNKTLAKPVKIYYSPDSVNWYYKGTLSSANSGCVFNAFDKGNFGFTFNYWLRFEGDNIPEDSKLTIETFFTFSEKVVVSNPERAFVIHCLNGASGNLKVGVTAVE